jgi:hypothetical protein
MLQPKEQFAKVYMEEKFVPALHKLLSEANPSEYKKWGGNACRQTAIFGTILLQTLLPEYDWSAWDGIFDDIVYDKPVRYNHAWILGKHKEGGQRLLVDLSRLHHERLFMFVDANRYPKDHPSYEHMKEVSREKINVIESLKDIEYYTKLHAPEFLVKLNKGIMDIIKDGE